MNSRIRLAPPPFAHGFSLLEIMVALALGLLLSAGILSLFAGTSRTNKLQNGLAQLQESGRFATTRIQSDMRQSTGQYCSNFSGSASTGTAVPVLPKRAPMVYAANLGFVDPTPPQTGTISIMNSVDGAGYASAATAAGNAYPLSPRFFLQGYSCASGGGCTPAAPADLPAQGLAAGDRLPASDILTVRYQRGTGWPMQGCAAPKTAFLSGDTLTVVPQTGDDPVDFNDAGGSLDSPLVLVTDCQNFNVLPVAAAAGSVLTLGNLLTGEATCGNPGVRDMRAFNFSKDFVTVTYYVGLVEDQNPDARPNSAATKRLIPTLMRRENGVSQELVQGVDQLNFLFGVQDSAGKTQYLTAAQVQAAGACPLPPAGVATEPGCMWRAVQTIEAHLLVNTGDEVMGLDTASRTYKFMGSSVTTTDSSLLPSGLMARSQLRREFIAFANNRNYNF